MSLVFDLSAPHGDHLFIPNLAAYLQIVHFPKVIELGPEYVVQYSIDLPREMEAEYEKYSKKVAFLWLSNESDDFVLLAVHYYGNLAIYRSRDKQWTALENTPEWCIDFISFNGKFYALYQRGRTLVVEPSSKMSVLPHAGSHTRRKFLVESGDELLLVDMFLIISQERDTGFLAESSTQLGWCGPEQIVWFKVCKLDEEGQNWDDVQSLGNRVLFLGENCSFSASAAEFSWGEGNCIIFKEKLLSLSYEEAGVFDGRDMYVFHLQDGSVKPLTNCPGYCNLFWLPPNWITSAGS